VLRRSSIRKTLRAELAWPPAARHNRLAGAGLIIVNPPWRLAEELGLILPPLGAVLARASGPSVSVDWLTPEG
jgi:23S rRNA (adenine2030-N6)-methyltransferase